MRLLLNISIDGLANDQEVTVKDEVASWLSAKYGRNNVDVDVNGDIEYDEPDDLDGEAEKD